MIIYKAINLINNKVYIGQTVLNLKIRKNQHEGSYRYGCRYAFAKAIHKYGKENFKWDVIDTANSIEELNEKESYYIKKYNSLTTQNGYNLKGGGNNCFLTDEVKYKIGKAQRGCKNHMFNRKGEQNPTSKEVINLNTNKTYGSASECARVENINISHICAVCRGDRGSTNGNIYRYLDEKGCIITPSKNCKVKNKKVKNLDTGEIFNSAIEAEIYYAGKKSGNLSKACKGAHKTFVGYKWIYI